MDTNTIDINSPPFTGRLTGGIEFNDEGRVVDVDTGQPLAAVPEPSTLLLFGFGMAGLLANRTRKGSLPVP